MRLLDLDIACARMAMLSWYGIIAAYARLADGPGFDAHVLYSSPNPATAAGTVVVK